MTDKEEFESFILANIRTGEIRSMFKRDVSVFDREGLWNWIESKLKAKDEEIERLKKELMRYRKFYHKIDEVIKKRDDRLQATQNNAQIDCVDCGEVFKISETIQAFNCRSGHKTGFICKECYEARIPL